MKRFFGLLLAAMLFYGIVGIAEAGSDKSATVIRLPDRVIGPRLNPCEGAPAVVTWSNIKLIVRDVEDPAGHTHIIETLTAKLSDSLGYSGHITWPWNVNVGNVETETEALIVLANKPGTGQTVRVQAWVHVTIVDGEPVVEFEMGEFTCMGKPAD